MTISEQPGDELQIDEPWARTSLRISGDDLDHGTFGTIIRRLGTASGKTTLNTSGDTRIWIDDCPLATSAPVEDQLAWAIREADAVFGDATGGLAGCRLELWIGLAVGAQLGVVCENASLRRLADLSVDLVLDLYGWD